MAKAGKSHGRQAGKTGQKKPFVRDEQASGIELGQAVKKPERVVDQVVQVTEKPAARSFDALAYVKSLAWVYPIALILIMVLMLYIRAGPSAGDVFTNWEGDYVNFANDDAVYHMRLVYQTVTHFPDRILYDPFTYYPNGSVIHFGPLFTIMIAGTALILGLGHPSLALIDAVGAYTPAILGMLCAVPTYFIGRKLFSRNVGIIAAFTLALLPGAFLIRSKLGFTDHHVAEVLFLAMTIAFMIYALDIAKSSGLSLAKIRGKDRGALMAMGFGALAGFSLGLYLLSWPVALLIGGFTLFIFFAAQVIMDHLKKQDSEYLLLLAVPVYIIPMLMVLPYSLTNLRFEPQYYSITQPVFLLMALAGIGFAYGLSRALKRAGAEPWTFPAALLGLGVVFMLALYVAAPQLYGVLQSGLQIFNPTGGMTAVGEAIRPTFETIWGSFYWTFVISVIALVLLVFRVFKDHRPAELLFLLWNLIMLAATFSQNRFSYYFAVNAALLTGYLIYAVFRSLEWAKFTEHWGKRVKTADDARQFLSKNVGQVLVFAIIAVCFMGMIAWPATGLSTVEDTGVMKDPVKYAFYGVTEVLAEHGTGMTSEWYQTLLWMRNNTPDPQAAGFSYDSGSYQRPANGESYPYPDSAYGVMAWWDYGHMITYVAHRIPNANPFQAGVTANNNTLGSAPFFLATTEDAGYSNLQKLGSRYVLACQNDANDFIGAMRTWDNDHEGWDATRDFQFQGQMVTLPVKSPKYDSTMVNRLYHLDGTNLSHFRLVYESPGNYFVNVKWVDLKSGTILGENAPTAPSWANYTEAYQLYQIAKNPVMVGSDNTMMVYDAMPPAKWIKLFEVVKGATITGRAAPGTPVTATLNLSTGERTFQYVRTAVADQNGNYELTVPYATEAMNGTGYSSNVLPLDKYTLTVDNTTTQVAVSEGSVQTGGIVQI